MASHSLGLTLHQAARQMGVPFTQENQPVDKNVRVGDMNFHYLDWGDPAKPHHPDAARQFPAGP